MSSLSDTYIADTFNGLLHSGGQPLPEAGLAPMYDGLGNESSLSLGRSCNGAKICGPLTVGSLIDESYDENAELTAILNRFFPVNSVYFTAVDVNPSYTMGGTWIRVSEGKFLVGVGNGLDGNSNGKSFAAGENWGEYTHTLTEAEIPPHSHTGRSIVVGSNGTQDPSMVFDTIANISVLKHEGDAHTSDNKPAGYVGRADGELIINNTGGGATHNTTPPSFGLYVWKRTA